MFANGIVATQSSRRRPDSNRWMTFLVIVAMVGLQPVRAGNQDEPLKLRTELVVIDAQVLHKKTALPIDKLSREDFILYEDGVKQHISHFSRDKLPLSVIILFDVSGSIATDRQAVQRLLGGAYEAMKLLRPDDEVALMQFAEKATLVQPFTRNSDLVVKAVTRLDGRGQYGTHIDEGILAAAEYMRSAANPDSRRAVIAVTDDVTVEFRDRSTVTPTTRYEGQALRELYESGSVLCALLYEPPETGYVEPYFKHGVAKYLAEATGGISIKVNQEDMLARLGEMIRRLRARYTIAYSSSNTGKDGRFRKIKLSATPEVEKREGGVALITRKGYYAK
jgi:Ca-activated chloride channel homolog